MHHELILLFVLLSDGIGELHPLYDEFFAAISQFFIF